MSDRSAHTKTGRKPSVLLINRAYPPQRSSAGRLLRELARALARDGWAVQVLTTDTMASDDPDGPVKVRRLPGYSFTRGVLKDLWLLFRLLRAGLWLPRTDVIVTLTDPPLLGYVGHILAFLKGSRHVHWCHDIFPDLLPIVGHKLPRWGQGIFRRLSRRAMNKAAAVVVVGRCMARYLAQHGVSSDKITLIPNWPELVMSPHVAVNRAVAEAQVDPALTAAPLTVLETDPKFRIMYVGTVGYAHPIDTILDAATILDSINPEVEFIFIGEQPAQHAVLEEKNKRGLSNVRVLPFQPSSRLRDIMESGDIHLISMKQEAAGMMVPAKFYAMMAAGRPCILVGPEQTEIGRVIADYQAGAVVPQKAAQALVQTILDFRMREDLWFTAHDGAIKAAAAYTAEDMIRLWLRKMREIVRR